MDETAIKDASLELLESVDDVYVTTIDENGYPQTRCMFNLRSKKRFPKLIDIFNDHKEDFMILFTTNTSSEKIAQLKKTWTYLSGCGLVNSRKEAVSCEPK